MPEYLSPGVYVEEVETGAAAIEGVGTSTAGFLGETERGPVEPEFVSSFAEFKRHFGGFAEYRRNEPLEGTNLAYAVDGFFRNGGSRCYVGRVTTATAAGDHQLGRYDPPMALTADTETVGFGDVVVGRTVSETVEIEHTGVENDPEITIQDIAVTGANAAAFDAVLPDGSTTPQELPPGAPLVVEVIYQPEDGTSHEASLSVDHNGADPPFVLPLSGQGMAAGDAAELAVEPTTIDYGTVPLDTVVRETVTVTNEGLTGADPVTINSVSLGGANPGAFDVANAGDFNPADLPVDGGPRTIEVTVEHGAAEEVEAVLEINVDGQLNPVEVTLRAEAVDPENTLGSSAVAVTFGETVTGTSEESLVVLRNMGEAGDNDLRITDVGTTGPAAFGATLAAGAPDVTLAPGETTVLRLTFAPTTDGSLQGTVEVTYDDGTGTPTRVIRVNGTGTVAPGAYAADPPAPADLTYGEVVVGESGTERVVVENTAPTGGGDVTIDSVDIRNDGEDEYHLAPDLLPEDPNQPVGTLAPGESLAIAVTVTPAGPGPVEADLDVDFSTDTTGTGTYALRATGVDPMLNVEAVGPGEWGGRIAVTVRNSARANDTFDVTIRYWTTLTAAEGTDEELLEAQEEPDVEEIYTDLTTTESSSKYYETVINSGSNLVEVERLGSDRPANGTVFLEVPPDDEADQDVGLRHYTGDESQPRGERTGLAGFAETDDINIVSVPDENSIDGLTGAIVSHCENMADRIAVLQAQQGASPGDLPPQTAVSEYAAIYYPHIEIVDPETGVRKLVPPGGHMAGVYARSDAENGVHKAPANETVRGAVDLEFPITKADQARLNPKGVNAIRSFPGRGIRVWGARTTSANPQWKYVNVRRLFLYIEESIDEGTQWAVFESNTERLWARVRQSVRNFLTTVWRDGGLAGTTPEEAFYVKADRTTMTQTDIDNGKLIVEIGVAPVKPAEFVIFRITQWTDGVEGGS
ncbi:choice-of-anchor D domain-containing protein [Haloarcula sp. 1CSR25-25]|nr:choice-of-anchor D domain-containing protein [Haloarcula sp. 1CSR25-25]MDT3435990.1 choice-of-anchor D domain-containing protein [Haloarcula sp. 1CSR25-25]